MRAIFLVPAPHETSLPPMQADDGYCLQYIDEQGILRGGYSCIGQVPYTETQIMWIEASDAVLDLMANDSKYCFLMDVTEPEIKLPVDGTLTEQVKALPEYSELVNAMKEDGLL